VPATPTPVLTSTSLPPTPATPTSTATPETYVVQENDTLGGIAMVYGITVEALVEANELDSQNLIYVGQTLRIPRLGDHPAPTAVPTEAPQVVLSPAPTRSPLTAALITEGDRTQPYVALTFDACQTPTNPAGYDAELIQVLIDTQTPATLFLGGLWMQSHLTQTQALAGNPLFELGNHSWSHPDFADLTPGEMGPEITMTQDIMFTLTGKYPRLFRLPFGTYDEEALATIADHGLYTIQWDVVSGDPDPNVSAAAMIDAVTAQVQNGSIVIMHMNGRGWHTAEGLPAIIERLRAQGYTFVTVSELLNLSSTAEP
jgi:peptidoglycan/xylan/chitin deacetylase (PgdA/CDA1 family)